MGKAFDELITSIRQSIDYEKGKTSNVTVDRLNTSIINKVKAKQSTNENIKLSINENFENFTFNPNAHWHTIYTEVIDKIVEKYWYANNRKMTIENKVYEFYNKYKNYESVSEAYKRFLKSDRLFED